MHRRLGKLRYLCKTCQIFNSDTSHKIICHVRRCKGATKSHPAIHCPSCCQDFNSLAQAKSHFRGVHRGKPLPADGSFHRPIPVTPTPKTSVPVTYRGQQTQYFCPIPGCANGGHGYKELRSLEKHLLAKHGLSKSQLLLEPVCGTCLQWRIPKQSNLIAVKNHWNSCRVSVSPAVTPRAPGPISPRRLSPIPIEIPSDSSTSKTPSSSINLLSVSHSGNSLNSSSTSFPGTPPPVSLLAPSPISPNSSSAFIDKPISAYSKRIRSSIFSPEPLKKFRSVTFYSSKSKPSPASTTVDLSGLPTPELPPKKDFPLPLPMAVKTPPPGQKRPAPIFMKRVRKPVRSQPEEGTKTPSLMDWLRSAKGSDSSASGSPSPPKLDCRISFPKLTHKKLVGNLASVKCRPLASKTVLHPSILNLDKLFPKPVPKVIDPAPGAIPSTSGVATRRGLRDPVPKIIITPPSPVLKPEPEKGEAAVKPPPHPQLPLKPPATKPLVKLHPKKGAANSAPAAPTPKQDPLISADDDLQDTSEGPPVGLADLGQLRSKLAQIVADFSYDFSAERFRSLEGQLESWTNHASDLQKESVRRPRANRYSRTAQHRAKLNHLSGQRGYRPGAAKQLRAAFWRNQKETVRQIIDDSTSSLRCGIPASTIEERFRADSAPHGNGDWSMPSWMAQHSYLGPQVEDDVPITASEVAGVLGDLKIGSAPGSDGLSYSFWKSLDPKGVILSRLFEICRRSRRVPDPWRHSRIILIPKDRDGAMDDLGNWRPIAICRTLYKIYASVVARRLQCWATGGQVISPEQKGFVPTEGVFEHVFMLDSLIVDAKSSRRDLYLAWLDIRNAFGSVRHGAMLDVLQHFNAPPYLLEVIADIYTNNVYTVATNSGDTHPIPSGRGVRQGCPLSAIIFNLVMEILLRGVKGLEESGYRYRCAPDKTARVQGYADDIALCASSREQLTAQFDLCEEFSRWSGMKFKPTKCRALALVFHESRMVKDDAPFRLGGGQVPVLDQGAFWRYLGKSMGYQTTERGTAVLDSLKSQIELLFGSRLTSFQKLLALKKFLLPKAFFHLRIRHFFRRSLNQLDARIRALLKTEFRLPNRACQQFFHSAAAVGGLGVPNLASEADVFRVTQAFKSLNSPDPSVRAVARGRLGQHAARTYRSAETTPALLAAFLNTEENPSGGDTKRYAIAGDVWTQCRPASRRLGVRWSVSEEGNFILSVGDVLCTEYKAITRKLHHLANLRWRREWEGLADQGKTVASHSRYACSNHFLRTSTALAQYEVNWLFKARLNLLPLRNIRGRFKSYAEPSLACSRCGHSQETLPHVLNHCRPVMVDIRARHDSIVRELMDRLPRDTFARCDADVVCKEHATRTGEQLRPDLVLRDKSGRTVVVDVACPFDNGAASLSLAEDRKHSKYEELCNSIRLASGKPVELHTFVVGALGSYAEGNATTLRALGVFGRGATEVARKTTILAIRGSHRVWRAWLAHGNGGE